MLGDAGLVELLEQARQLLRVDPDAGVPHRELDLPSPARHAVSVTSPRSVNLQAFESRLRRIWRRRIGSTTARPRSGCASSLSWFACFSARGFAVSTHVVQQGAQVDLLRLQLELAGLDLGEIENLVDQLEEELAGPQHAPERLVEVLVAVDLGVLLQHLA